jgi:serine/threonine-protein kinase
MSSMEPGGEFAGWRIDRELARGGMGVLYLARHPRLPRVDVLKVLPPWLAADTRFRERFLREANRVSSLSHPHIVVVHDSGEHEGTLYLVMQYVRGGDLRAQVDRGPLPPERAVRLGEQVASALDAAHRAGLVHRDVKPENVLLAETGPDEPEHAVLTDFGISRDQAQATTLTASGELLLTPAYAAPEQVAADPVDGRADQYALACMLYELLTGRPPYRGGSSVAMLAAHLNQPVQALPPELGLPGGLDRALQRAMAKNPQDRFPSCRAFLAAARQGMQEAGTSIPALPRRSQEAPTTVSPPSPPPSPPPPMPTAPLPSSPRRWPVLAGLGALVAVVAGVALVSVLGGGSEEPQAGAADVVPRPGSTDVAGAPTGSADFLALLERVPEDVRSSCREATSELNPAQVQYVSVRATCTPTLHGDVFDVTYDAIKGDEGVGTTYRRSVLGIGGSNNGPGDCRTRMEDPQYASLPADRGYYMSPGPEPLNIDVWCDYTGAMYLLEPDPDSAVFVRSLRRGDDGDVDDQRRRYDDLASLKPS